MPKKTLVYGPGIAGSIKALAECLEVDETAVRKWMAKDEWSFGPKGPFKVKRVKIWRDKYIDPDLSKIQEDLKKDAKSQYSKSPLTKARVEGTRERTLLIRQQRLAAEGKLISVEEAQRIRLRQIRAVKSVLLSLSRSLPSVLIGKTKDRMEELIKERVEGIIRAFAGK